MNAKNPEWRPRARPTRSIERPIKRWVDGIRTVACKQWMRLATDRERWKRLRETYIHELMDESCQRRREDILLTRIFNAV